MQVRFGEALDAQVAHAALEQTDFANPGARRRSFFFALTNGRRILRGAAKVDLDVLVVLHRAQLSLDRRGELGA